MKAEFGLNLSLKMISLPKNSWYYHQQIKVPYEIKYQNEVKDLMIIIKDNPGYGYKRAAAELKGEPYNYQISQKVVQKLMKNQQLLMIKKAKKPRPNFITPDFIDFRRTNEPGSPDTGRRKRNWSF